MRKKMSEEIMSAALMCISSFGLIMAFFLYWLFIGYQEMKSQKIKRIAARKRRQRLTYKVFCWILFILVSAIGFATGVMLIYIYTLLKFR